MNINVRYSPGSKLRAMEAPDGTTAEKLLEECRTGLVYKIYAARINNRIVSLKEELKDGDELVFLDLRDYCAKQIYQQSVIDLFCEAVREVHPGARAVVRTSLNKGIYTKVSIPGGLTMHRTEQIERKMKALVKENIPFESISPDHNVTVPSTGYINEFDLKKCRDGIVIRIPEDTHPGGLAPYKDNKALYKAFRDESDWADMLDIVYTRDLNDAIRNGSVKDIIQVSEALQERRISDLAETIVRQKKRIILIAGPSSSGKTSFAHRLCIQLWSLGRKPIYLGTDDYYKERSEVPVLEDGSRNFENLDSLDVELFNTQMNALLNGDEVDIPSYDFGSGTKKFGIRKLRAKDGQPIVIEGIHGLNDDLTSLIAPEEKFKIYISPLTQLRISDTRRIPVTDIRKLRRIIRDASKRNWDAEQTMEAWPKVREGEDVNIFPYSDKADAFFNSSHIFELAALRSLAEPLLKAIPDNSEYYCEACRLLEIVSHVEPLEDLSAVPCNSILREFVGGSSIV